MTADSTLRVKKWADYLYSFAAIVVFGLILPVAILSMVYFVLEPVIPDAVVRILMSAAVGVAVGGFLLLLVKRNRLGTTLLMISNVSAAVSLSIGWAAIHATVACFHTFSLLSLVILFNLFRRGEISRARWGLIGKLFSAIILVTAPLASFLTVNFFTGLFTWSLIIALVVLYVYIQIYQYFIRKPRLGIVSAFILSFSIGILSIEIVSLSGPTIDLLILSSLFLTGSGIGLLAMSQIFRRMQLYLFTRKERIKKKSEKQIHIMTMMGIEIDDSESLTEQESEGEVDVKIPWLIDPYDGHALSSIAMVFIAIGEPFLFLWMASRTGWIISPSFMILMLPLALLFSALILAPAPVFLRFAFVINREKESIYVRVIGLSALIFGCSVLFVWTQYFAWQLVHSVSYSILLFIAGLSGLFRSIRRLWKLLWLRIVHVFRELKYWVRSHILISGIIGDTVFTLLVILYLYPFLITFENSLLLVVALGCMIFTTLGTIGLAQIESLRTRVRLVIPSVFATLASYSVFTFWAAYYPLDYSIQISLGLASAWFLLSISLLRIGLRKQYISCPYVFGVLGVSYLAWAYSGLILAVVPVAITLLAPLLWSHYVRFAIISMEFIKRHYIAVWGVLLLMVFSSITWFYLQEMFLSDPMLFSSMLSTLYLLFFLPAVLMNESITESIKRTSIIALAVSMALFGFLFFTEFVIVVRLLISASIFSITLAGGNRLFSESIKHLLFSTSWTFALLTLSLQGFYILEPDLGALTAASLSAILFGIGWFPIRAIGVPSKFPNAVYLLTVVPSAVMYLFMITGDYLITFFAALLLPLPVTYELYYRFSIFLASAIRRIIQLLIVVAIAHLVIVAAVVAVVLAAYLTHYFLPLFSAYPNPLMSASFLFVLITFCFWFPALFRRRSEHPNLYSSILIALSIVIAVNAVTLLNITNPILAVLTMLSIVFVFVALTRQHYPEVVQKFVFPAVWLSVLMLALSYYYFNYLPADLTSHSQIGLIFGLGLLPLRRSSVKGRVLDATYFVIALGCGSLWIYLLGYGITGILIVLLLIPIPLVYHQYALAIRIAAMYIALYLVIFSAIFAGVISLYVIMIFIPHIFPLFQTYLDVFIFFVVLFIILWIPSLVVRKAEYGIILTIVSYMFDVLVSILLVRLIRIPDAFLSTLLAIIIFGMFSAMSSHLLEKPIVRNISITIFAATMITYGVFLLPMSIISQALVLALGYSLIALLYLGPEKRELVGYISLTSLSLASLFSILYTSAYNLLLFVLIYLTIESFLLLFIPRRRFMYQIWMFFSISLAILVAYGLYPFTIASPAIGLLLAVELLRKTPNMPFDLSDFVFGLGLFRSALSALFVFMFSYNLIDLQVSIFLSIFVFIIVLYFSGGSDISETITVIISLVGCGFLSLTGFRYLSVIMPPNSIVPILIGLLPLLFISIVRSKVGPHPRFHWRILGLIVSGFVSILWYQIYPIFESVVLVLITGLFMYSLFELWNPFDGLSQGMIQAVSSSLFIVFLESIWIWHSVFIYTLPLNDILLGATFISLLTIILPMTRPVSWFQFEPAWELVSLVFALIYSLPAHLTMYAVNSSIAIFQYFGSVMIVFSLVATPGFYLGERANHLPMEDRVVHGAWFPAVLGAFIYSSAITYLLTADVLVAFGVGCIVMAGAGLVLFSIWYNCPKSLIKVINLVGSIGVAVLFYMRNLLIMPINQLILMTLIIWMLLALSITYPLAIRLVNFIKNEYDEHFERSVIVFPFMFGVVGGILTYLLFQPSSIMNIPIRHYVVSLAIGLGAAVIFIISEIFYFQDLRLDYLKKFTLPSIWFDAFLLLFGLLMPSGEISQMLVFSNVLTYLATSTLILSLLGWAMQYRRFAKGSWGIMGLFGFLALLTNQLALEITLADALLPGLFVFFILEIPVIFPALVFIARNFFNLGVLIVQAFKQFMMYVKKLFEKWGYFMWAIFSIAFSITLGVLSYPFFSDFVNMNPQGLLYTIPSFSMPLMILGLLLVLIAIVRRTVRSRFGYASGFLAMLGMGITLMATLADHNLPHLALLTILVSLFIGILIINQELELSPEYITITWVPVPVSSGIAILLLLLPFAPTLQFQLLSGFAAFYPALCIMMISTRIEWMPTRSIPILWVLLSAFSGAISYLWTANIFFVSLASLYFAVFVAAIFLYPLLKKESSQLFLAPMSFGITGFAFTFIFGVFYQSLLLALSASLLFLSRFLKIKESQHPQLVYMRFITLLALIGAISIFVLMLIFT